MAKKTRGAAKRRATGRGRAAKRTPQRTSGRGVERRKQTPVTLRLRTFQPSLTVADLDRSVKFYTDVLGFIVGQQWKGDDGVLRGVMLKAGSCELGLSQDDWKKGRDRKKGEGVRLWCTTAQDVDELAARVKSGGWRLTEGPMDMSWGGRSLSLDDPDGFHLTIYREP